MLLYVMRHGPAEDRASSGRDADRALTTAGRELVVRAAGAVRKARGNADLPRVVSSPLRRAHETATLLAALAASPQLVPELHDELADSDELPLRLVTRLVKRRADAAIVGHQPTVERLVRHLVGRGDALASGFRTGMVVALELGLEPSTGALLPAELRWAFDPHAD